MKLQLVKQLVLVLLTLALGAGCTGVSGNGTAATDTRSAGAFSEVEVGSVVELHLTLGAPCSVQLSGDANLLPLVDVSVHGDRLVIDTREGVRPKLPLVATVTAPNVKAIEGRGAARLQVDGVDNEQLELELSGAGSLLTKGKTKRLEATVSGAGTIDAAGLEVATVRVRVSGAGTITVAEPAELDVDISGAGSVSYAGTPKLSQKITGAGTVKKR